MTIDREQWAKAPTFVHTFASGRSAELRTSLGVSQLVRSGAYTEAVEQLVLSFGGADVPTDVLTEGQDIIVCAMFVDPAVSPDGADGSVPLSALDEEEITEVVALALGGRELLATFRGDRAARGADRAGDGDAAEHDPARLAERPARRRGGARSVAAGAGGDA